MRFMTKIRFSEYYRPLITGGLLTLCFALLFLYFNKEKSSAELLLQTPYLIVLYFLVFTIGQLDVLT